MGMVDEVKAGKDLYAHFDTTEGKVVVKLFSKDAPKTVEKLLKAYLAHRSSPDETFLTFARRHDGATLRTLAEAEAST